MITEEMMAAAAAAMNEAMLRSLPEPEDCHHDFSPRFEKKMKRVIYRADHPLQFRILQRVASIILALFLDFATIMLISPTVRASVFGWIREQYESFIAYYCVESPIDDVRNAEYYIDGLDDDFSLIESYADSGIHFDIYQNSSGEQLHFTYSTSYYGDNIFLNHQDYNVEQVSIGSNVADLYISKFPSDSNCIIWFDESVRIMFFISAPITSNELIDYANNTVRK